MMYAVLSLGLALLGGIVRLAQVLRLSAPLLRCVGIREMICQQRTVWLLV